MSEEDDLSIKALFGRAFLLEIEMGRFDLALLFAKAFLAQDGPPEDLNGGLVPAP